MKASSFPAKAALAVAVMAAFPAARAQQAVEKGERIEITGSRLAVSSDIDTPSPVAIIRAEDLKNEGFQSLELILNNYPQFFADQGARISNGASGTATANLRALGADRTLVLVNGRRMPAGSVRESVAPDLNQIPMQLIQRVEILTGGASAVYGSDAMAGVVNFILNDHFEGVQGDVSFGFYNHRQKNGLLQTLINQSPVEAHIPGDKSMDGESTSVALTMGGNFARDKGNAVVSFRYLKSEALTLADRDYSACPLNRGRPADTIACGGAVAGNPGLFLDLGTFASDPDIDPVDFRMLTIDRNTRRVRDYNLAVDRFNFAPYNYYQRPQERYGFNAMGNYDVTADLKVYGEFGYHDDHTVAKIAPSAMFDIPALVRWENPLLNDDWRANLIFRDAQGRIAAGPGTVANLQVNRRNSEGGARTDDRRHTSFREVIGLKGAMKQWDYDLYFQTSRVNYQENYTHDFSVTRSIRSLDVVTDPRTGMPACVSALSGADSQCVPFNVWSIDAVSAAALQYVEVPAFQRGFTSQQVLGATATTNLGDYGIRVPNTKASIELALGFERRSEKLGFEADSQFSDLTGQGEPVLPYQGGFVVKELFGELRVPLLDIASVNASYRWSDFDTGVRTNTFGIGFTLSPWKTVRLRGSFQRAVRAPNVIELFSPQLNSGFDMEQGDPCAGVSPARPFSECRRTGVTADRYGRIVDSPTLTFASTTGGNPRLEPESARTYTAGIVLALFRNFSATIDYFDIRLRDTISAIEANTILEQCLETGNPFFCDLVRRDPQTQTLWFGDANINAVNRNIGRTGVSGADFAFNYRLRPAAAHGLSFDMLGTWLRKQSIENFPGAPSVDCQGLFGSDCTDVPLPRWRHRLRTTWQTPWNLELAATWRYIGGTKTPAEFNIPTAFATQPPMNYLDLAATWEVTKSITLRAGMNNATDRDPPIAPGFSIRVNGNAFAQVYDALGRHIFVSATARF